MSNENQDQSKIPWYIRPERRCCVLVHQKMSTEEPEGLAPWLFKNMCDNSKFHRELNKCYEFALSRQLGKWKMMSRFIPAFTNEIDYRGMDYTEEPYEIVDNEKKEVFRGRLFCFTPPPSRKKLRFDKLFESNAPVDFDEDEEDEGGEPAYYAFEEEVEEVPNPIYDTGIAQPKKK